MESQIHFESGRTGCLTCSFQGKYLHSKYNPEAEGERFAESVRADFSPLCVFVLEPALSYCAPFLRKRFPAAVLCAIRFCGVFSDYDAHWDFVFHLKKNHGEAALSPLSEDLFSALGEEKLISSLAFDWNPSKQAFSEESLESWAELKKAILKARDVIGTRAYFSKRWLKNSLIFAANVQNAVIAENGNSPIVIAASGPSLAASIPFIKKFRDTFFLIAVSSAFMPLSHGGITPDAVISSDGGFWAKKHLDFAGSDSTATFALEAESAVPKKILRREKILPLVYADGLEKDFLNAIGCPYMISERNGTVAGTALTFALALTSGNIYLCGLDQAPAAAFQHTQPNALETDNARKDFHLKNAETRITSSRFNSAATLEIYRNWFAANSGIFAERVFRLSDNFPYEYGLGKIRESNWTDFEKNEKKSGKPRFAQKQIAAKITGRKKIIIETLRSMAGTEKFKNEVFPMDTILIKRELSDEKKAELKSKSDEKISALIKECEKLL